MIEAGTTNIVRSLALSLSVVVAAAGLGISAPSYAGDDAKKEKNQKAETAAAGATTGALPENAKAPKIERETMGEWELECFDPKVNGLKCQIGQRLVSKDSNSLVLVVSIAYSPVSKKHVMQIALPLNFMLKPGVELAIGDSKTVIQVDRCSNQGCFVEGVAGDDVVDAMVKGNKADVKFLANPEKRLVIPFSLSGFTAAYEKMKKMNEG